MRIIADYAASADRYDALMNRLATSGHHRPEAELFTPPALA